MFFKTIWKIKTTQLDLFSSTPEEESQEQGKQNLHLEVWLKQNILRETVCILFHLYVVNNAISTFFHFSKRL